MKEFTFSPVPHYTYNDGNVSFTTGPGFYGNSFTEMLGIPEGYHERINAAYERVRKQLCPNPNCPKHNDVTEKYETEHKDYAHNLEVLSAVFYELQPSNATELATICYAIGSILGDGKKQNDSPFSSFLDMLQTSRNNIFSPIEKTPEQALDELLRESTSGNSSKTVGTGFTYNSEGTDPAESYGIPMSRIRELTTQLGEAFKQHRLEDGAHLTIGKAYEVKTNNANEASFLAYCIGVFAEKLAKQIEQKRDLFPNL